MGAPSLGPEPATVVVKCRGVPHDLPGSEEAGLTEPYVQDPSFHLLCAVSLGKQPLDLWCPSFQGCESWVNSLDSGDWVHSELVRCGGHC